MPLFPSSWDDSAPRPSQPRGGLRVTANARDQGHPSNEAATPAAESRPADVATVLAAAECPRQQEIARQIYARLKAGADVDDVTYLIGELSRVAAAQTKGAPYGGGA